MPSPDPPASPILTFLGAAGTVTGSRFLVESPAGGRVLVDCGLFQGVKALRLRNWEPFPVPPATIDTVVLSHAHVDHCGYVPALVRDGFGGRVLATRATVELAGIVLPDSGHLQEEEAAYANRKGFSKHHPALPLYTEDDAHRALPSFEAVPYGATVEVARGVRARLEPAGHILGSAIVTLEVDTDDGTRRVVLSGDLGRPTHPLLGPPAPIGDADVVLVESTYGDRRHDDEGAVEALARAVRDTAARGGTIVIPAFAVDRTEVVLFHLRRLRAAGRVPELPVYVDSPMALAALAVYRRAIHRRDPDVRPELVDAGHDLFDPGSLAEVHDVEGSMAIDRLHGPKIVISASGMATGGRVLHHLARALPDRRSTVVLVGFQAERTRGRLLAEGARQVKMLGRYVPVRCEVVDLPSLSVHADADELEAWLRGAERPPDMTYLVHGEPGASAAMADRIETRLGWPVAVPRLGERVRID